MRPFGPGRELAPGYEVIAHLARSKVLDVYDVWSHERACRCIVKLLRRDRRGDERAARALQREGSRLQRLSHPHLVRGYETLCEPLPAVVMETLHGETVAHLVERHPRRLSAVELGHLGVHLCSAIHDLHGQGVLHLDLKPSNVIAEAGRAKIIDLSLARELGDMRPGIGTWCYMAPEQARGGDVGPTADVWTIAGVLRGRDRRRAVRRGGRRGRRVHSRGRHIRSATAGYPPEMRGAIDAGLRRTPPSVRQSHGSARLASRPRCCRSPSGASHAAPVPRP